MAEAKQGELTPFGGAEFQAGSVTYAYGCVLVSVTPLNGKGFLLVSL